MSSRDHPELSAHDGGNTRAHTRLTETTPTQLVEFSQFIPLTIRRAPPQPTLNRPLSQRRAPLTYRPPASHPGPGHADNREPLEADFGCLAQRLRFVFDRFRFDAVGARMAQKPDEREGSHRGQAASSGGSGMAALRAAALAAFSAALSSSCLQSSSARRAASSSRGLGIRLPSCFILS
jgi:hypothetical protein